MINTRAGDSFPALFFHDSECESTILQKRKRVRESFDPFDSEGGLFWGGDEVLRWLRRYVEVQRSAVDRNVYLINPSEEDQLSFGHPVISGDGSVSKAQPEATAAGPSGGGQRDASMDPFMKTVKETRWKVLEHLSKITTFTRRTASEIVDNPRIPPQMRRLMKNPEIQTLQDEFDSARLYLARWAMSIAEQSERERQQRIWTAQDVLESEDSSVGEFEILELETGNLALQERRRTLTLSEWEGFFDPTSGRLQVTVEEVKERIFHGGLDPNDGARKEAWLFLLGVFPWDSGHEERQAIMNSKRDEYIRLKAGWWERMVDGNSTAEDYDHWKEQRNRIGQRSFPSNVPSVTDFRAEKDVHRTDRTIPLFAGEDIPHPDPDSPFADTGTNVHLEQMKDMLLTYNEYNPDLGYVQGMSDLLAPLYAAMQDDAVAFWAFVGFMDRMVSKGEPKQYVLANRLRFRNETSSATSPECVPSFWHLINLSSSWTPSCTFISSPPTAQISFSSSACYLCGTSASLNGAMFSGCGRHSGPTTSPAAFIYSSHSPSWRSTAMSSWTI